MADTKALRGRIKSARSTLHLTKAMELVASSKIRRANEMMYNAREYAAAFTPVIHTLTTCKDCEKSVFMQKRDTDTTRLLVIAGDRGMAGGYNANIFRLVAAFPTAQITPIGKRAGERFDRQSIACESFSVQDAASLSQKLCADFAAGLFNRLGIVYTKYVSMVTQEATVQWVLPLRTSASTLAGVIFEPEEAQVLLQVVPMYVTAQITAAVKESFASEVAARRMAMHAAGKNAQQMVDTLQQAYNRVRQSAITQEITEIVAGS